MDELYAISGKKGDDLIMGSLRKKVLSWNIKKDWSSIFAIAAVLLTYLFKEKLTIDNVVGIVFLWTAAFFWLAIERIGRLADIVEELKNKNSK